MKKIEMENLKETIAKIERDGIEEILKIAIDNIDSKFNTVIYYDMISKAYIVEQWPSFVFLNTEVNLVEVYRSENILNNLKKVLNNYKKEE